MKNYLQIRFLIISILFFSCKGKLKSDNKRIKSKDSIIKNKKYVTQDYLEYYFVSASSGLNYRDSPNGNILGKFPLNSKLKIIKHTELFDEISDNDEIKKGEWLGVETRNDTVYVFSAFLSGDLTFSDIKLFYTSPYYITDEESRGGFVNISELYFLNYNESNDSVITKSELSLKKEKIKFNQKRKGIILKKTNISNNDTVYIYNFQIDSIYKFQIADISTIAYKNTFSSNKQSLDNYDYEIGFNLNDSYKETGEALAYIGQGNPFQTRKLKSLIWKKVENRIFPSNNKEILENLIIGTYIFTLKNYKYFIQSYSSEKNNSNIIKKHHLIIKDSITNQIISELFYKSGESIFLTPLATLDNKIEYYSYWTGEIFKNKPPIIYGLESNSFGCPKIDFIKNNEPSIRIFCDNRH